MSPDLLVWDMKTLGWLYSSLIHENFIKKVMCYSLLLDISKRDMLSTGFTSSKLNQYPIFMDYAVYNLLIFFFNFTAILQKCAGIYNNIKESI